MNNYLHYSKKIRLLWGLYDQKIKKICLESEYESKNMSFWRDYLFATALGIIVPLSLLVLIPSLYIAFLTNLPILIIFDILAITGLWVITFFSGIKMAWRKWIFISIAYGLGILLTYLLGNRGPGLLFLLAVSIFMVIVLPVRYAFSSVYLNFVTCFVFSIFLFFREPGSGNFMEGLNLTVWIANASNLVFLSAIFSLLIPKLLKGLQESIEEQFELRKKLSVQKEKLKQSLKELEEKNTELEHFAYVASHDLQEPLRMVTGFLQLLKEKYVDKLDSKAHSYIKFSIDGATRMRDLILDLLEYSRLKNNYEAPEKLNLNSLIGEIKNTFRPEISKSNATIQLEGPSEITCKPRFLSQVFQNLIGNALKYRREEVGPKIIINCEEHPGHWLFSVKDNGIGMDPAYVEKIFIIFQRLHAREKYGGTGIGLAIVKKIIEHHGGKIWVDTVLDQGSTFYFTVPKMQISV